jgi:hypothetical protein
MQPCLRVVAATQAAIPQLRMLNHTLLPVATLSKVDTNDSGHFSTRFFFCNDINSNLEFSTLIHELLLQDPYAAAAYYQFYAQQQAPVDPNADPEGTTQCHLETCDEI